MKKQLRIEHNEPRKYKINECLLAKTVDVHRYAVRIIPKLFGISLNTFHNYRNILWNDTQDIPHEMVVRFEQFFELPSGTLLIKKLRMPSLRELVEKENYESELGEQVDELVIEGE